MEKSRLVRAATVFLVLSLPTLCFADQYSYSDPWKIKKQGKFFEIFGEPFTVQAIEKLPKSKDVIKDNACYYQYRLIIRRPGRDDGSGVSSYKGLRSRLYYWAATLNTNPYALLFQERDVYQHPNPDPNKVDVYLVQALRPGRYRIALGIIPYPMIGDYSLKTLIRLYGHDYATYYTILRDILSKTNIYKIIFDQVKDLAKEKNA